MRILGIDLGKTSLKAVELDTAFGRYELHEYHERVLAPGETPEKALPALIESLPKKPDRIVLAIRTSQTTFRNIQLPTRDKKAIQAGVAFELEDELPFAIEEAIFDYRVLSQTSSTSQIHVSTTREKNLQALITSLAEAGVSPDVITTEAWAFRELLSRMLETPLPASGGKLDEHTLKPTLLVHLGHDRSIIYVHHRGVPIVSRELKWGGADLTLAICQKYAVPIEQAENTKIANGFVLPESQRANASAEQIEFSDTLQSAISNLVREIRQAELACKGATQESVGRICLSGGTSLLPGLAKRLSEDLRVPVQALHAMSSLSHSGISYSEETDAKFALAAALALTQVGSRGMGLNLRKGVFAKQEEQRSVGWEAVKGPLLATSAILICMIASFAVRGAVYQSRIKEANTQLEKSVKNFFGGLPPTVVRNYLNSTSTLKKKINAELNQYRELSRLTTPNPRTPLEFFREISAATPRDLVLDVTRFQVGASAISQPFSPTEDAKTSITVLVANPQMIDRFAAILGEKIQGLEKTQTEEVPGVEGGPKRWKITFTGTTRNESYGK